MLEWLESTELALWVAQSPSVWSMPTVLTLHTGGLALLVGSCWVLDLRLLGISRTIPLSAFRWIFPVVAIGLVVNVLTGVLLFIKSATTWGTSLPFFVKMALVVASVATVVPIRAHVLRGGDVIGLPAEAPGAKVRSVRFWAIASILSWSAAVTAGRLLAYLMV
jgi:hypothetical protein